MPAQASDPRARDPRLPTQVCTDIRLSDGAADLLSDELEPMAFVRLLHERTHYSDGIQVLARLFPKREAVWWACQCTRQSLSRTALPKKAEAAVSAAEAWVGDPSEENRRVLFALAQGAGMNTGAGLAAFAAFASGGSMVPPEFDVVAPEETMTAELAGASVIMAGLAEDTDAALEKYGVFLEQGVMLYEQSSQAG